MMTGHIPESFINNLRSRIDIVDIIGERVRSLRKAGANFVGLCPFHEEKTPSFSVSPTIQRYHCFGCNEGGDVIDFLIKYDGLQFVEAVEVISSRLGVQIPYEGNKSTTFVNNQPIYDLLTKANQYFVTQLRKHNEAKEAIEYLKNRGITGEIAKKFSIGYASSAWDSLSTSLLVPPFQIKDLINAGLVIQKDNNRVYDRFRNRIMFPIRDRRGRVVGFGGRIIKEGEPKYLNSPETPVFNKGTELYGIYEARQAQRNLTSLIVVEGYLDVISLVQAGIPNTVATLGTAFTEKHLEILFKLVSEVILCFDGDKAGREAAIRAMKLCLPCMKEGRRVRFAMLPDGHDPDSFVRKEGQKAFLEIIRRSEPLSDFIFDVLGRELDLEHIDGRAELINLAKPLISLLPEGVYQKMMWEKLAELTKISLQAILGKSFYSRFGNNLNNNNNNVRNNFILNKKNPKSRLPLVSPAFRAIAILWHDPTLIRRINTPYDLKAVDIPGVPLLCALMEICKQQQSLTKELIIELLPLEYANLLNIEELKEIVSRIPERWIVKELEGAIRRIEERAYEQALEELLAKAKTTELSDMDKARLRFLLDNKEKNRVQ